MSSFALLGLIILAMASLGEQFIGIDDSGYDGEYLVASSANMIGDMGSAGGGLGYHLAWQAQIDQLERQLGSRRAVLDENARFRALAAPEVDDYMAADNEQAWVSKYDKIRSLRVETGLASDPEHIANVKDEIAESEQRITAVSEGDGPRAGIILMALAAVELLEQTAGFGPPYEGADLKIGSDQFSAVGERLGLACAGNRWRGLATQGYVGLNAELGDRVQEMAELDLRLAGIIKAQADSVTYVKLGFGILKTLLVAAYVYELQAEYESLLPGAVAAVESYAAKAAAVGIGVAATMIVFLIGWSGYNAARAAAVTAKYHEVGAAASGGFADAQVRVAVRSPVGGVETVTTQMRAPLGERSADSSPARASQQPRTPTTPVAVPSAGELAGLNRRTAGFSDNAPPEREQVLRGGSSGSGASQVCPPRGSPTKADQTLVPANDDATLADAPAQGDLHEKTGAAYAPSMPIVPLRRLRRGSV